MTSLCVNALHLQVGIFCPPKSSGRLITAQYLLHKGSDVLVASARALEIRGLTHAQLCSEEFASSIYLQADAVTGNIENVACLMRLHLDPLRHAARFLETSGALLIDYLKVEPAYRGHRIGQKLMRALAASTDPASLIALEPCPMEHLDQAPICADARRGLERYWQKLPGLKLSSFGDAETGTLLCAGQAFFRA